MYLNRKNRNGLISWQRHQITLPRFQMTLILLFTGFIGFLSSFLLLHSGVSQMWLRYPLSILSAYAAFLLLLRLWLAFQRYKGNFDLGVNIDFPIDGNIDSTISEADFYGGGGDAGGAGAGGSWGDSVSTSTGSGGGGSSVLDGFSFDIDLEGIVFLIIAAVALLGALIASLYIIYIAPVLLAEILVDGLLLRGLQNRFKNVEPRNWLRTAISRTLVAAIFCALFFGIAGAALHMLAPKAKSVGEVWKVITSPKQKN